jgi:hypothetical protein
MISSVDDEGSSSEPPLNPSDTAPPRPSAAPASRLSFFDDEYVGGQRVPSPPTDTPAAGHTDPPALMPSQIDLALETDEESQQMADRINHLLLTRDYVGDFKPHLIPSLAIAPETHHRLMDLLTHRNRIESDLENLHDDIAADGTPLDPTRDIEPEYERLSTICNNLNREMLTEYAQFLGSFRERPPSRKRTVDVAFAAAPEPLHQDEVAGTTTKVSFEKTETASGLDTATAANPATKTSGEIAGTTTKVSFEKTETASGLDTATAANPATKTSGESAANVPCPYTHAKDQPAPPLTVPQFETISMSETTHKALFMAHDACYSTIHTALADSGASHILFRESQSDCLSQIERCQRDKPFAVLKTANGAVLKAIGRGQLTIAQCTVTAYIFRDAELAHNLLGLIPFANLGCTMIFQPHLFGIYLPNTQTPFVVGSRTSANALWTVDLNQYTAHHKHIDSDGIPPPSAPERGVFIEANAVDKHDNASYVRFVHASLGYPAPSTFLRAVTAGYITGPNQFPRLTPKMVRKHLPNAMPTAKGHLDRTRSAQLHKNSDAVSARQRHHTIAQRGNMARLAEKILKAEAAPYFVPEDGPRSTRLHMDYTGPLPERFSAGTLFMQVSVWGGYINLQPLTSLRAEHTAPALQAAVEFFRRHGAHLTLLRMDNQRSQPLIAIAKKLELKMDLVPPFVKNPNRTKRAIRTGENHIIATRAGFHLHCPHVYLDKCLMQIELTLNIIRPFEYDPTVSAYEGLLKHTFNFKAHPIAPVGTKVLTWDAPDHRGSWADHGVEAVYLGPATDHFRAFHVWVPNASAPRITNTVWWFLNDDLVPDTTLLTPDVDLAYPPTKARPQPRDNGADLIGRAFFEPELGICLITGLGPVAEKRMSTRAQKRSHQGDNVPLIAPGAHHTLMYKQIGKTEEHYSSLSEILFWIEQGPLLQPPQFPLHAPPNHTAAPITTPSYVPATLEDVPRTPATTAKKIDIKPANQRAFCTITPPPKIVRANPELVRPIKTSQKVSRTNQKLPWPIAPARTPPLRVSSRLLARSMPSLEQRVTDREQRVTDRQQRVSHPPQQTHAITNMALLETRSNLAPTVGPLPKFIAPLLPPEYDDNRTIEEETENFIAWCELNEHRQQQSADKQPSRQSPSHPCQPIPASVLPPVFPTGPLNLNPDGSELNYRKSHAGPHAKYWERADGEEIERLVTTGTIKPCLFRDIPSDKIVTYVNPICVEKTNDDGSIKFRTRLTIGGDRILYPDDTSAVTRNDAIYFSVHKTHYGLPQAGALSQQRLFAHLRSHGYSPLPSTPAVFRNAT